MSLLLVSSPEILSWFLWVSWRSLAAAKSCSCIHFPHNRQGVLTLGSLVVARKGNITHSKMTSFSQRQPLVLCLKSHQMYSWDNIIDQGALNQHWKFFKCLNPSMTIFLFTDLFVAAPTVNYSWASRRRVCVTVAKSKCKCSLALALAQHPPTQNTHEGSNESQLNESSRRLKFYNRGHFSERT